MKIRRQRVRVAGATLVIVAGSVLAPTGSASAALAPSATLSWYTDTAQNLAASQVAQTITDRLRMGPGYAGVQITRDGVELDIVGAPSPAVAVAIREAQMAGSALLRLAAGAKAGEPVPVAIRSVSRSLASLDAVTSRVDNDAAGWAMAGIQLSSWGPDLDTNTVRVHLVHYTPYAAARLREMYGSVLTVDPTSVTASPSNRLYDTPPWYGGDLITNSGGAGCTSYFPLYSAAWGDTEATSGHCGVGTWYQNGNRFGTVNTAYWGSNMDGAMIPVSSDLPTIFADPAVFTRTVHAVASSDPIGGLVCTGGISDREVCSVRISAINQTVTYTGVTVHGLVFAYQTALRNAFSAGDSGGPVYSTTPSTGNANAYGMIEARVMSGPSEGWYMPARTINSFFGVTIKTR